MLSKVLSGISLIALVAAIVVVATGQTKSVEAVVGTGEGSERARQKAFADTPLGETQTIAAKEKVDSLAMEAQVAYVQATVSSRADLIPHLKKMLPESFESNGEKTVVTHQGDLVFFCLQPNFYAVCSSINVKTGRGKTGEEKPTMKQARKSAT